MCCDQNPPKKHKNTQKHKQKQNKKDVAEALRRLPPDTIVSRNQRLKRAMDLSLKHETLPKELRDKQTPFEHYLLVRGGELGVVVWFCCLGLVGEIAWGAHGAPAAHQHTQKKPHQKQTTKQKDIVAEVKAEKAERYALGTKAPYQRTIP